MRRIESSHPPSSFGEGSDQTWFRFERQDRNDFPAQFCKKLTRVIDSILAS
jgi:hypothetical protein